MTVPLTVLPFQMKTFAPLYVCNVREKETLYSNHDVLFISSPPPFAFSFRLCKHNDGKKYDSERTQSSASDGKSLKHELP